MYIYVYMYIRRRDDDGLFIRLAGERSGRPFVLRCVSVGLLAAAVG